MRAKQEKILKIVITAVMVILGLICIYPFIFMLSSSFKPSGDVLSTPPPDHPFELHHDELRDAVQQ